MRSFTFIGVVMVLVVHVDVDVDVNVTVCGVRYGLVAGSGNVLERVRLP